MSAIEVNTTRRTKRKILAILAGGLVLGIGAAVTLATWNDSEFATGTFTAGSFNVQGSLDGTTFADHPSAGTAAAVTFSTGFNSMSPNDVVAAPFVLRLDAATTNNATALVTSAAGTGTGAANFTYGIIQVASVAGCTPAATGTATLVPAGTALTAFTGATSFNLAHGTGGLAGASVFLCIQVKASAGLVQGSTATGTWGITATSV
jgi:predicted ribosomally synthesized peptide with SipW-like signal peptide